ncbi:tagatose 6-phosphate kinase [Pricia antarctica]|uniref:Tagatose 6-phosphate kinase n=1 Tax=Pricia antarctica TaxID=641691 RepID=A0A1G6XUV2_9FLAO|nr:hypothetical protein [Pricia antarctica]SDD81994.1 tagatose 6-phosphate kinase [Pricia antarctica]
MILAVCPNPSIDTYAWLTVFKKGQANRISGMMEFPGGKGIHVAMALKELILRFLYWGIGLVLMGIG